MRYIPKMALWSVILVSCGISQTPQRLQPQTKDFVQRDGLQFKLNGRPFYYAGANNYYLMTWAADVLLRTDVMEILDECKALGIRVIRTWAFNDGAGQWNALQTSPGVFQESVFVGLDFVLHEAAKRDLRLVLPLVNNWDDYGGMNQYVAWSPTAQQHDDFYTDQNCKAWYKNFVRAVLNRVNTFSGVRYRNDPTIFAWELANEARCSSDPSGTKLANWTMEMADYVKSLDPLHLLTTGAEGFYLAQGPHPNPGTWADQYGCDFVGHHQIDSIDYATVHLYPDAWGIDLNRSVSWVEDHLTDAQVLLGKPLVLEEFGKPRPVSTRNTYFRAWYDSIYQSASGNGAGAGSHFWILYHDSYPDYDGLGIYAPADTSTLAIIQAEAARMNSL